MKQTLLETKHLSKSFSNGGTMQHILKNIDLTLFAGDFTVIMGGKRSGEIHVAVRAFGDGYAVAWHDFF